MVGRCALQEGPQCPGQLSFAHLPTSSQGCPASAGAFPALWTWGRATKSASQVLPAQKVPLPRSSSETQAAAFPAPPSALSSSEALVLNPSLFQMWQHLIKAEAKLLPLDSGGHHELSESEYTDVLDQSCSQTWQG